MLEVIPYLSLALTVVLIYWPILVAERAMKRLPGGYDNNNPRDQQAQLTGAGRRALAAHQNGLEAFPIFAAAVLAAVQREVDLTIVAALCVCFLLARTIYVIAYLSDRSSLRSAMFGVGLLTCLVLFGAAVSG